jgi:perosamine synthetase
VSDKPDPIPYGRQSLDEADIEAVVRVLRSDWLTTGPQVDVFEQALTRRGGAAHAVAVSSGTAALHCAMAALDIGPGDEVIVPAITFVATANAVLFQGGRPVFADLLPDTLLLDPQSAAQRITPRTRALVAVDYAGQPCDYDSLRFLAQEHGLTLVADACHSLGASYRERPVGSLADVSLLSFHPVKPITSGEGGALLTDDAKIAERARRFRSHGIGSDFRSRESAGTWEYQMLDLGYNYRITDIQCALGESQLSRLDGFIARRQAIAARYDRAFADLSAVTPLRRDAGKGHGYHLYVVRVDGDREGWFRRLREMGVGVNVHYQPVYLHPFYRERFGTGPGLCPVAEAAYERILSLPIFPAMDDSDVERVIDAVRRVAEEGVS